MVVIIVAVVALVLLAGGGGVLWWWTAYDRSRSTLEAAAPTLSDLPTPPTYSPPSYTPPSYTPPSFTPPSSAPTTSEPTYSPPPRNYGAIAVSSSGAVGKSWDHDSPAAAQRRARNECAGSCKVLATFVNGCGAVAYNSSTNRYWGGRGDTRSAAQRDARSNAGGGRVIVWVCTTR